MTSAGARRVLFAALPTLAALTLLGLGFLAGGYSERTAFTRLIRQQASNATLGDLLAAGERDSADVARVYRDPVSAAKTLGNFSWSPPIVPTPYVGHAARPGRHANAHINAHQMRAEQELRVPKPEGVYRIFLTGASTAYGSGAPSHATTIGGLLASLLNEQLAPRTGASYEVMTLAHPGWASTHERIAIENRLSELEPDLVLSLSGNNDVHWALWGRNVLWFRAFGDEFIWQLVDRAHRISGEPPFPDVTVRVTELPAPGIVAQRLVKNLRLASFALQMNEVPYVFALQPNILVTQKGLSPGERRYLNEQKPYFEACYQRIRQRLQRLARSGPPGFHFVDLSHVFDDLDERVEIFLDSYHFGDRGNEQIARALYAHIEPLATP